MAENITFDFSQEALPPVDDRISPLESAPVDPSKNAKDDSFSLMFNSLTANSARDIFSVPQQSLTQKAFAPVGPSSMGFAPDSLTDKYMYQKGFEGRYFNAFDPTNYQKFADKETWGSALDKGFDSFGYKFGNTFKDYWKGYGRMADALFSMDWDKMRPDEETMMETYYKDQIDMKKNFVFEQPENEDSIFSKRTMSEFVGNAGFALGTFAGLGIEIAADIAITALTGGAGAETFALTAAGQAARVAARQTAKEGFLGGARVFGKDVLEGFGKLGAKSVDELRVLNKIDEAGKIASAGAAPLRSTMAQTFEAFNYSWLKTLKSKSFSEFGENLLKGTPLLGTGIRYGERVAAATKGGASAGQVLGLSLQGLRRVGQEMNMAATEASFEAVTSYGDTLDKMVQQYKIDNNGEVPSAQDFEKMRSLSMQASSSNFNTNMAILLATNKLQFGTLFNKFIPASMIADDMAEQILRVEGKAAAAKLYKKGLTGTYGVLGQVAKDFGKKQALYQFGKAFAKDALAFEIVEGLQENLQETTAAGWRDYYAGQMNGTKYSLSEAFGKGAEDQFTKQGLKTFLMGALTGSIIRLPTAVASRSLDAANRAVINNQYKADEAANPLKKAEKQLDEDLKRMNDLFKQSYEGKFEQKVFNFNAQVDAAQQTAQGAAKGSRYEFENGKDNALLSAVASAKRTNSIDMLYNAVKGMGVEMTNEDFEKSFGYKLEDTKYATAQEFSEAVAKDIKKYSDTIDNVTSHVKNNLANPFAFSDNSRGRFIEGYTRRVQDEAIQIIALNAVKGEMSANRAKQVASDILAMPGMSNSADYAIRTLTNEKVLNVDLDFMASELANLQNNLKSEDIDAATKKELEKQIELKEKEIQNVEKWKTFWATRKDIVQVDEEGEVITEDETTVFVGEKYRGKIETVNENGEYVLSEEEQDLYSIDHPEVLDTFRNLMNIRNQQAGSDVEISEQTLRDSFGKVYDYMRLDKDTADYMRSVDQLLNPENYKRTVARMLDGKFKQQLSLFLNVSMMMGEKSLEQRLLSAQNEYAMIFSEEQIQVAVEEFATSLLNYESYTNLLTLISNKDAGVENKEYGQKLITEIQAFIKEEVKRVVEKTTGVKEETEVEIETPMTEEPVVETPVGPGTEGLGNAPINAGDQAEEVIPVDTEEDTFTPVVPIIETPVEETPMTEEELQQMYSQTNLPSTDEFSVTGNSESGFDVVDKNNNTVTDDKIESQEKAEELSASLNATKTNLEFAKEYIAPMLDNVEDASDKIKMMSERGEKALDRYNRRNNTEIKTLEEFNKIPEGKKFLTRLSKSIVLGKPLEAVAQKPVIIEPSSALQLPLFDTTETPSTSASLTLEGLQTLHNQIQQSLKPEVVKNQTVSEFADDMFPLTPPEENGKAFGKLEGAYMRDIIIEKNGVVYVGYKNIDTETIDIYFAAQNENEYLGYMRVYENDKPTERFTSKLNSLGNNKAKIKEMAIGLQSMMPVYHEYSEDISVSTDGLRWFVNQLKNGYELLRDQNNEIVTTTVSINGSALVNELGITVTEKEKEEFDNLPIRNQQDFNKAKEVIEKYLKQMGVTEPIVRHGSAGAAMTARFNLPVLVKRPSVISNPEMQQISEKSSKFVEGGIVTEESILNELRKITDCFS
jgi:hypothetical protein